jgi:hypothetical protein
LLAAPRRRATRAAAGWRRPLHQCLHHLVVSCIVDGDSVYIPNQHLQLNNDIKWRIIQKSRMYYSLRMEIIDICYDYGMPRSEHIDHKSYFIDGHNDNFIPSRLKSDTYGRYFSLKRNIQKFLSLFIARCSIAIYEILKNNFRLS